MKWYAGKFQLLLIGFDIPNINLLILMKIKYCGGEKKCHPVLQFVIIEYLE